MCNLSQRALDKLFFQKSTVLVHLKKKGGTRNCKEYSPNAFKNLHAETKKLLKHTRLAVCLKTGT